LTNIWNYWFKSWCHSKSYGDKRDSRESDNVNISLFTDWSKWILKCGNVSSGWRTSKRRWRWFDTGCKTTDMKRSLSYKITQIW
jgi:hypothetical protein